MATIQFREYIPGYCDGVTPRRVGAVGQAELLATPWIASRISGDLVARNGEIRHKPFHRFSLDDDTLIAEYDDGHSWTVLGYIEHGREHVNLPKWVMHPDAKIAIREWNKGNTAFDDGRFATWPLV